MTDVTRKASDILLSVEEKLSTLTKVMYAYDLNLKLVLERTNKIYAYIEHLQQAEKEMMQQQLQHDGQSIAQSHGQMAHQAADISRIQIAAQEQAMEVAKEIVGQRRGSRVPVAPPPSNQQTNASRVNSNTTGMEKIGDGIPPNRLQQELARKKVPAPVLEVEDHPTMMKSQPVEFKDYDKEKQVQKQAQTIKPDSSMGERKVPVVQRISDQTGKDLFMADVSIYDMEKNLVAKSKTNVAGKWQAQLRPGKYTVNIIKTDTTTKSKTEATQEITIENTNVPVQLPVAIVKHG